MDMGTAVVMPVGIVTLGAGGVNIVKTFCGNNKDWNQFSHKLTVALSDIASIKQSVIDLSCYVCDRGPNGDGKNLRDKIIYEMMKHRGGKGYG